LPARQLLTDDGHFTYVGGELPLPPDVAARTVELTRRAVALYPGLIGYVGVDAVLGTTGGRPTDAVIEINPRLTTSYVGLRASTRDNLVAQLLAVADGREAGPIRWEPGVVKFDTTERVSVDRRDVSSGSGRVSDRARTGAR
jgi:predicted ATP-grasp superfamily ATP-dependent carboligase